MLAWRLRSGSGRISIRSLSTNACILRRRWIYGAVARLKFPRIVARITSLDAHDSAT